MDLVILGLMFRIMDCLILLLALDMIWVLLTPLCVYRNMVPVKFRYSLR
jgi:hypothetical protein